MTIEFSSSFLFWDRTFFATTASSMMLFVPLTLSQMPAPIHLPVHHKEVRLPASLRFLSPRHLPSLFYPVPCRQLAWLAARRAARRPAAARPAAMLLDFCLTLRLPHLGALPPSLGAVLNSLSPPRCERFGGIPFTALKPYPGTCVLYPTIPYYCTVN